jgi:fructose-specific phosphotransferase system component IIB
MLMKLRRAKGVIVAADKAVEMARFFGKPQFHVQLLMVLRNRRID